MKKINGKKDTKRKMIRWDRDMKTDLKMTLANPGKVTCYQALSWSC